MNACRVRAGAARVHVSDRPGDVYELVTVDLSDLGDGRRRCSSSNAAATDPEQYEGAEQGWRGFFDVIAERLASG